MKNAALVIITLLGFLQACNTAKNAHKSAANKVSVWLTTPDQRHLLARQAPLSWRKISADTQSQSIVIYPDQTFQSVAGFGYTLTDGSARLIHTMTPQKRAALLRELFGAEGLGVSFLRLSMGASDLSDSTYTYDDMPAGESDPTLRRFSVDRDTAHLIPVLREIFNINKSIQVMAVPWSPPVWMKRDATGYGGFQGGTLDPRYYAAYAEYFARYVDAMRRYGTPVFAVAPQNEPLNPHNNPSLYMSAEEQAAFIKSHLGPRLEGTGVKIVCYDHNADRTDYAATIFADKEAGRYVDGAAFHLYGGDIGALSALHAAFPDKRLYFTEQWIGGPGNFAGDFGWHMRNVVVGAMRNWCRTALEWNLANGPSYRPHTPGGCTNCLGALTIAGDNVSRNTAYYVIGHASRFVRPGALRIASEGDGPVAHVAFKNERGDLALIVFNGADQSRTIQVRVGERAFSCALPAGAAATLTWR